MPEHFIFWNKSQTLKTRTSSDTYADVEDLVADFDYQPKTTIEEGVTAFVRWYRDFYGV